MRNVVVRTMPKQGLGGTVGIVEADEGRFTYKVAGPWKKAEKLDRDLSAFEFLNGQGFPYISQLLKTTDDRRFLKIDDELVYLIKYVEGGHPSATTETYGQLGVITAALHAIKDFPFETDYKPADALPDMMKRAETYTFGEEYRRVLLALPDFTKLTIVPIHTEITVSNVIQAENGAITVIDWDEVGLGPAVLDLGVAVINNFITEDLEVLGANARAYYDAYFSRQAMSEAEKKYIFDAGVFWACSVIPYGDADKRWKRIKWALENRGVIEKAFGL